MLIEMRKHASIPLGFEVRSRLFSMAGNEWLDVPLDFEVSSELFSRTGNEWLDATLDFEVSSGLLFFSRAGNEWLDDGITFVHKSSIEFFRGDWSSFGLDFVTRNLGMPDRFCGEDLRIGTFLKDGRAMMKPSQ